MPRKILKRSEIKGCPFRAGDIVRKRAGHDWLKIPTPLIITSVSDVADLHDKGSGYGPEVRKLPYWFFSTDMDGKLHKPNNPGVGRDATWVGFVELDPFLGPAKRAVMEHGEAYGDLREH